jgi:hypothetical protein
VKTDVYNCFVQKNAIVYVIVLTLAKNHLNLLHPNHLSSFLARNRIIEISGTNNKNFKLVVVVFHSKALDKIMYD